MNDLTNTNIHSKLSEKSIAVLPFVNMSSDPENEYFSDGITEEIINALTKIQGLKVIARTSSFLFKGKNEDVRKIGNLLGVTSVLEGSVRKIQNRVRITAQLINTLDGTHFWSKNFDREMEDIFALQDEISLLIADQIRENFGHFEIQEHLFDSQTKSIDAYNEYQKGRYYMLNWSVENFHRAVQHYKKSSEIDPNYPLPYYGIVMTYTYLFSWNAVTKDEARKVTDKYLEILKNIGKELPEYHLAISSCAILFNWDLDLAHTELKKTLKIGPNYTDALEALAGLYIVTGWFSEAIEVIDKALKINPLSANHHFMKGNSLYFAGEYSKAIQYFDKALDIQPQMNLAILLKMSCSILLNEDTAFKKLITDYKQFAFSEYYQQLYSLIKGEKHSFELAADAFENEFHPWELYFNVHSGNMDKAIDKLESELKRKNGLYFCFRHDPFLRPVRNNKRYKTLETRYLNFSFSKPDQQETTSSENAKLTPNEIEYFIEALQESMNRDKIFLDASLSLKTLSDKIQIHPNKLSWLINECLNKNFNEYINQFRLAYFKEIALMPENSHIILLGLAFESGFNSKTVFNSYFKKIEDVTPGNWLKEAKQ